MEFESFDTRDFGDFETELEDFEVRKIRKFDRIWTTSQGGSISAKPIVSKGKIYFGSEDGNLYCLNLSGKPVWRFKVDGQIWDEAKIYKDILIFGSVDCKVHYLDLKTGKELWNMQTSTLKKSIWSRPYEMFRVEIKKEAQVEEAPSEKKYKKPKGESVSLSDYKIESEYTTESEYKTKSDYDVEWVIFQEVFVLNPDANTDRFLKFSGRL